MKKTKLLLMAVAFIDSIYASIPLENLKRKKQIAELLDRVRLGTCQGLYTRIFKRLHREVVNFKPTAEMRTFGQQMLHLSEANYRFSAAASGKASPVHRGALEKSDQHKTKAAVTKAVMESYDFVIAAAKEMRNQKMGEMVKLFASLTCTGGSIDKVFEHQTHHRGQTTVYLRLKGITPPNEKLF